MAQVDSEDTPARPAFPPRTPQEQADELLMRWRLARAAGVPADRRLLEDRPQHVRLKDAGLRLECSGNNRFRIIWRRHKLTIADLTLLEVAIFCDRAIGGDRA